MSLDLVAVVFDVAALVVAAAIAVVSAPVLAE